MSRVWKRNASAWQRKAKRVAWPLDKHLVEPALQWVPNYASVREHLDFAKEKFGEDIAEGMMEKMTSRQFREKFGEDTAVAALAVIVEDETIGKKRMIRDASHGVRVNHRIRCRDKIRAPGAREKKTILRELREREEVAFSVVGDISKAHRRFKQLFWHASSKLETTRKSPTATSSTSTRSGPSGRRITY